MFGIIGRDGRYDALMDIDRDLGICPSTLALPSGFGMSSIYWGSTVNGYCYLEIPVNCGIGSLQTSLESLQFVSSARLKLFYSLVPGLGLAWINLKRS